MGFRYWYEGVVFVLSFAAIIALPCTFVSIWGSQMINEMGNFPTKTAKIQVNVLWKIILIQVASFGMLIGFFKFFS